MPDPRLVPLWWLLALAGSSPEGEPLRWNQIQVIGSHNSYHIAPDASLLTLAGERGRALDYTHRPLAEQFSDLGIRQIELDVFADPEGGLYADPSFRKGLRNQGKDPGPDPDKDGVLRKPGMKVLHVQDFDYRTTVPTFVDGLKQVRAWSKAHPRHVPIVILVELKDEAVAALPTKPLPFDAALLDAVDAEIRSVFGPAEMFTPDDLRGPAATLPEAITGRGWPKLDDVRGKVIFALDNEGAIRDRYLDDHPGLKGRPMFATVDCPDHPAAAWFKINDPVASFDRIRDLVERGFVVRTRADADTKQARQNDTTQRDKALASGAQLVSTDYAEPRREFSDYNVRLPDGVVARPNPVSAPGVALVDAERSAP